MKTLPLLILLFLITSCAQETKKAQQAEKEAVSMTSSKELHPEVNVIAKAHGLENWKHIEQINFTFNVDREGKNVAKRSWIWNPKTDDVRMITAIDTLSYNRSKVDSTSLRADQGFINDKFWLLAPFQIAWDEGTTITTKDSTTAPLSEKPMKKLTLTYSDKGGYTPGDAYDFYYDNTGKIVEWVFRKSNAPEPSMMTTFEGYKDLEGMLIATDHKDKDGNLRLYFTDVSVYTKE